MSRLLSNAHRCRCPHLFRPQPSPFQTQKLALSPSPTSLHHAWKTTRRDYSDANSRHEKLGPNHYATQRHGRDADGVLEDPKAKREADERWKHQNPVVRRVEPVVPKEKADKVEQKHVDNSQSTESKLVPQKDTKSQERVQAKAEIPMQAVSIETAATRAKHRKMLATEALRRERRKPSPEEIRVELRKTPELAEILKNNLMDFNILLGHMENAGVPETTITKLVDALTLEGPPVSLIVLAHPDVPFSEISQHAVTQIKIELPISPRLGVGGPGWADSSALDEQRAQWEQRNVRTGAVEPPKPVKPSRPWVKIFLIANGVFVVFLVFVAGLSRTGIRSYVKDYDDLLKTLEALQAQKGQPVAQIDPRKIAVKLTELEAVIEKAQWFCSAADSAEIERVMLGMKARRLALGNKGHEDSGKVYVNRGVVAKSSNEKKS